MSDQPIDCRGVIVATDPAMQRAMAQAFAVPDPWQACGLHLPNAGPVVRAAAAIADPMMVTRMVHRVQACRVVIVTGDPFAQCLAHYEENRARGIEWRSLDVAIAHERAHLERVARQATGSPAFDDVLPIYGYTSLASHARWLTRWQQAFGARLLIEHDLAAEGQNRIAEHLGHQPRHAIAAPTDSLGSRHIDSVEAGWIRTLLHA